MEQYQYCYRCRLVEVFPTRLSTRLSLVILFTILVDERKNRPALLNSNERASTKEGRVKILSSMKLLYSYLRIVTAEKTNIHETGIDIATPHSIGRRSCSAQGYFVFILSLIPFWLVVMLFETACYSLDPEVLSGQRPRTLRGRGKLRRKRRQEKG